MKKSGKKYDAEGEELLLLEVYVMLVERGVPDHEIM
jgi:hypothetical protein